MADITEEDKKSSEDYKSVFPFGTRFPYSKSEKLKSEDWVFLLDNNKEFSSPTYRYTTGKNSKDESISKGFTAETNATFLLSGGGNELVEAVPASKISNKSLYYIPKYGDGVTPSTKPITYFSIKGDNLYATIYKASEITSESSVEMKTMLYEKVGNEFKSIDEIKEGSFAEIKEKVRNCMGGNTAVQLGNIELSDLSGVKKNENEKHLNIYQEGRGKFLDLRIYKGNVAGIMSLLGKDFLRTDNLFLNSTSWKEKLENSPVDSINESVQLIPDNFVFKSGIKYTLGQATEVTNAGPFNTINKLAGGAAMIEAISKSLKNNNGEGLSKVSFNERINRYRNIPYFKDMDNICIDSLNFSFQYGQFGLYSCEEEVVKPILQLASIFSYHFVDEVSEGDKEKVNNNGLYIRTPYTNKFEVLTKMYNSLFLGAKSAINIALNSKPSVSTLNSLPKQIVNIVNTAAQENVTQAFTFRIGSSVYGPFYASDVRWEFEYERTNKNGLPFAGNIVISGIKPLLIESFEGLLSTGGQILDGGQQQ